MHIVVSWDISAEGQRWKEINDRLKDEGLEGFSWVRPLSTFYVVRVNSETDRSTILQRMQSVADSDSGAVNFVLSPVMSGGRYNGFLPKDMWPEINERSDT